MAARRWSARAAADFTSSRRNCLSWSIVWSRLRASQARTNAPSATRGASDTASPSSLRACVSRFWNSASKTLWSASGFGRTADVDVVGIDSLDAAVLEGGGQQKITPAAGGEPAAGD